VRATSASRPEGAGKAIGDCDDGPKKTDPKGHDPEDHDRVPAP
jgi:hypothetical protein